MSEEYGCVDVVVDAKPDAVEFYTRFGFSPLEVVEGQNESRPEPTPMFPPLSLIEGALPALGELCDENVSILLKTLRGA